MRNAINQNRARALRNQATDTERHLWRHLRNRQLGGHRFRRQVPIGGYIADFACLEAKLIIELDGGQHQHQAEYDARRDRQIEVEGFRVLRFWDNQVFQETPAVLEVILRALEGKACPHPSPPPQAGEGVERGTPQAGEGAERGTLQAGDEKLLPPNPPLNPLPPAGGEASPLSNSPPQAGEVWPLPPQAGEGWDEGMQEETPEQVRSTP